MKKYIIECPKCGLSQEVKDGFFHRKIFECQCGNVIDIRKERFELMDCPHCGNTVIYDHAKGNDAMCPVCHRQLITDADRMNLAHVKCPSCFIELTVNKKQKDCTCPLCNTKFNVQEQIIKDAIKAEGRATVIKYQGPSTVMVWKHPTEDFSLGSQLIVHEGQEAIFFRDGLAYDGFGPGRYTLQEDNLPLLDDLYKLSNNTTFHTEVYFVNKVVQTGIKWGTDSKVRMFDPASGLHVELGACGEFNIEVSNAKDFLTKLIGTTAELKDTNAIDNNLFDYKAIGAKFRALVISNVKSLLAKTIREENINILEIDEHIGDLSNALRISINRVLNTYGLNITEFLVTNVMTPDYDPNFKKMKEQYAEQYLLVRDEQIKKNVAMAAQQRKIVEAQTGAQTDIIAAQAKAEAYRLQAEAEAQEMRMKGYSYNDETQRKVSLAATEGMANGNAFGGYNPINDIVGLGVGLSTAERVADMTKNSINNITGVKSGSWSCSCGEENITSKFCPNCGLPRPVESNGWECPNCHMQNITSNFCPNCGTKKPEENTTWDCECGEKNISSKFCPNCGKKRN